MTEGTGNVGWPADAAHTLLVQEIEQLKLSLFHREDQVNRLTDLELDLRQEIERLNKRCAALALLVYPVHPDPTGKTREPPHCPSCSCSPPPQTEKQP